MPMYEFQVVGGAETIERYFPAAECPELGSTLRVGEKVYRRILSRSPEVRVKNFAHVVRNLPMNCKGAPAYDKQGRPAFSSQKQVEEFAKRNGMHWD